MDKLISLKEVHLDFNLGHALIKPNYLSVLNGISFDLYRGEKLGVIGGNGSGKSTLLRILAGIYKPDRGELVNYGATVSLLTLQLGFDNNLTGRDNVLLSGMLLGFRKKQVKAMMADVFEYSGLGKFIDQPIKIYSNGMRARLGFAVAITMHPDIILIDEVLGVGDVSFKEKSLATLKSKLEGDQTIVFVSHSALQVRELCDRALWIEDGKIKQLGDTDAVMTAYEKASLAKK